MVPSGGLHMQRMRHMHGLLKLRDWDWLGFWGWARRQEGWCLDAWMPWILVDRVCGLQTAECGNAAWLRTAIYNLRFATCCYT